MEDGGWGYGGDEKRVARDMSLGYWVLKHRARGVAPTEQALHHQLNLVFITSVFDYLFNVQTNGVSNLIMIDSAPAPRWLCLLPGLQIPLATEIYSEIDCDVNSHIRGIYIYILLYVVGFMR